MFPTLPLFTSVTNGIEKLTVETSLTNANIRALVLDDQDLINVEDPSMVLLVKLNDVNSMNVNGMEKIEDSVDENSLADLNDLKETINELASNKIQHPISKENMDQEDDINKVSPEITVSSDLSRPPGFEHMKRTPNFLAKAILWNRIGDFMHQHAGKYIIFRDMNVVRNENKSSGSLFSQQDADSFNSFIDNSGLIDLPLGSLLFTWIKKAGTKLSKLNRFLISKEVAESLPDVCVTAIDYLWSDHNLILLHVSKSDFEPTHFKLFHSWRLCDSFDEVIKTELPKLEEHNFRRKLLSHEKFHLLKARIKQWLTETKTFDGVTKHDNLQLGVSKKPTQPELTLFGSGHSGQKSYLGQFGSTRLP
ncbi:RNA-directed DNA polymerase, eukaryota, reverse transcriptase zinc-binding domain protein [Tanacetum coccineum]|uniref:RNA-directed DNA polymerase, eukaryota, reverse transcriptase zinc-binding domain protein n=1 Tax=Tanacetum coccineum TaxID=301880 RepID=A0ABQ4YX32_9ASTR